MLYLKRNRLLLIFIFLFCNVLAQTLPSKNITINDGLPSNSIKCFFKDSRGLLWIGTDAGLCCYNGATFKIYNETNGLKHTEVWAIVEDRDQNLWLSLYGNGFAKFDGKKFTYFDKKDGLINNSIRRMFYSNQHNCLVLGTENGISIFDGKHFKSFVKKTVIGNFQVVGIAERKNKILFTVSYDNVYNLNISSDIQKSNISKEFTPTLSYSSYFTDENYYGGIKEINIRNFKTGKEKSFPSPIIWDYTKDDNNTIYGAGWNVNDPKGGLIQYSDNKIRDITLNANITSTALWCLYYDKPTKQLWVGSIDKGIFVVNLKSEIQFYEPSFYNLKQFEVQCLYNDSKNNLWIGGRDNIIIKKPNLTYKVINKQILWDKINVFYKSELLNSGKDFMLEYNYYYRKSNFSCFNITEDNNKNIWVTTTLGYFCFDKNYNATFFCFSDGGYIAFNEKEEFLYGEMYKNFFYKGNKFAKGRGIEIDKKNSDIPNNINTLVSHNNIVWFGTRLNGLFKYEKNQFYSLNQNGQFTENNINELKINDVGELIIGTNSGRVYVTRWKNNKLNILKIFQPNKELFGTSIQFIEQCNGAYFIGTNKGINVIQNNRFVKLVNKSEGINDIQFNYCTKDKNNDLWIATNGGILKINVKKILTYNLKANKHISITSIKVNGVELENKYKRVEWGSISNQQIRLDYYQNDIEVYFETYNLFNADKNLYRYKIIGLSNTWSQYENLSKIQLLGLPSGKYTIVINGKNIGTGDSFQLKKLHLIINPPVWKTWWFISIIVLLLVLLIFIGYKKRIEYIAKEEQTKGAIQKRLAETKMEALQSQMNPHFIFNAMNSIQNFIIDNNTDEALMYMGEFSKLIRQTLENSSKQRISLVDEIQYLKTYIHLENMRLKDAVQFKLNVKNDIDIHDVLVPPMIIQPFIENIFVHAFDSRTLNPTIEVSFNLDGNTLLCNIKDNGKGMSKGTISKLYSSKGINLVKERIGLIQNSVPEPVIIDSNDNLGTTVLLKLCLD